MTFVLFTHDSDQPAMSPRDSLDFCRTKTGTLESIFKYSQASFQYSDLKYFFNRLDTGY